MMKSLKTVFTLLSLFGFVCAFGQGQTGLSDRKKNVSTDCGKCDDAWVTQAYYDTWGSCPGTGQNAACNYKLESVIYFLTGCIRLVI